MAECLQERIPQALAVGCSGGPDSMALTALLNAWSGRSGATLTALIVNHGLRPEAGDEARRVAEWLRARDVMAEILEWSGEKPDRNIQAEARRIRYQLIGKWCQENDVPIVAVAHHLEDQSETFLLRLARGSGVDGLSSMPQATNLEGFESVRLIRPLLSTSKTRLEKILDAEEWPFVRDPSNQDRSYARVRMRALTDTLAREGLDAERLAKTAIQMQRAREALESVTDKFLQAHAVLDPLGFVHLDMAPLRSYPREIVLRVMSRVIAIVSGAHYPVRLQKLEACVDTLIVNHELTPRTLGGCRVEACEKRISIYREVAAIREECDAEKNLIWDRRFRVDIQGNLKGLIVRKLGRDGVAKGRKAFGKAVFDAVPAVVRPGLPALWRKDQLVAIGGVSLETSNLLPVKFQKCEFICCLGMRRPC